MLHEIRESVVDTSLLLGVVCDTYGVTRDFHVLVVIFCLESHEPRPHFTLFGSVNVTNRPFVLYIETWDRDVRN